MGEKVEELVQSETRDSVNAIKDMEDRYTRIKSKLTEVTRTSKRRLGAAKSMGKKHEEALERMERELQGAVREQRDMEDQLMQVRRRYITYMCLFQVRRR